MERGSIVQRGAVLVEFALSSLIVFTVLYGTLQLGLVGLEQIKADGAAFTGTHQQALYTAGGVSATTLVPQTYPGVSPANMSFTPQPLPSTRTLEPVDYALTQTASRHGGFSMILPLQTVGTVLRPMVNNLVLGITGSAFTLSGLAVEPAYQEVGVHGDVNGTTVGSNLMFTGAQNYFTQGENTPPYFVGFKYMTYCSAVAQHPGCTGSFVEFDALGLAEYLDVDNWKRTTNGVTTGAVFADTMMHQGIYAQVSHDLAAITGGALAPIPVSPTMLTQLEKYLNPQSGDPKIQCMYQKWDSQQAGGYALSGSQIGDFPLNPGASCQ